MTTLYVNQSYCDRMELFEVSDQFLEQNENKTKHKSLFSPFMKSYVDSKKQQQLAKKYVPLKFKGIIINRLSSKNATRNLSLSQGFKIWYCKRNTLAIEETIESIFTTNKISPQCFLFRLKTMCRKELKAIEKQSKEVIYNHIGKSSDKMDKSQQTSFSMINVIEGSQLNIKAFLSKKICLQSIEQSQQRLSPRCPINTDMSHSIPQNPNSLEKLEKLGDSIAKCQDKMIVLSVRLMNRLILKMIRKRVVSAFKMIEYL